MKSSYSGFEAVLHNTLLLHFDRVSFQIGETSCTLTYFPQCPEFEPVLSLNLQVLQDVVKIDFSSLSPLGLHPDMQDIGMFHQLPTQLRQALSEYIFEDAIKKATQFFDVPFTFLRNTEEEKKGYPFYFSLSFGEEKVPLCFWVNGELIKLIVPKLKSLPEQPTDISNVYVECAVIGGTMSLTLEEARNLEAEDILIPESLDYLLPEKRVCFKVCAPNSQEELSFICSLEGTILTILEKTAKEATMSEEESKSELKDIQLQLTFELERRKMTLSEVEALKEGTNILLNSDPLAPVTINILNTPFAKARLVDIDGNMALQITEILLKKV